MYCKNCGQLISDNTSNFCTYCGTKVSDNDILVMKNDKNLEDHSNTLKTEEFSKPVETTSSKEVINVSEPTQVISEPSPITYMVASPTESIGLSIASLVLGIVGIFAWLLPLIGFPVTIVGLILGLKGMKKKAGKGMASAGFVLCVIFLIFTAINSFFGLIIGMYSGLNIFDSFYY